jgi:hypothetical protein
MGDILIPGKNSGKIFLYWFFTTSVWIPPKFSCTETIVNFHGRIRGKRMRSRGAVGAVKGGSLGRTPSSFLTEEVEPPKISRYVNGNK